MEIKGRAISRGVVEGEALVSYKPISFLGGINRDGIVVDRDSDIYRKSIRDKILVFPTGKGSTVGSYVIYALGKRGILKGIVNRECEPIVATGAILARIPLVDRIDISRIDSGDWIVLDGNRGLVKVYKRD
ncbi:MAG TPA: DUF126 domain-containing protein [Methanothermococcus okinawensis]|uniref:Phosphomevalonate dehydratase small subunit n=1 Tax=Methanothermococcus okinawensis TaxID=155863 RepID=A0A832ZLB4_9EURY|nr:DUF126 domain-containing protein [Methanothermococcus okinawensis]HIP91571.1 DUF126 domain-containing protein [Methanothermococcus okinawensis]